MKINYSNHLSINHIYIIPIYEAIYVHNNLNSKLIYQK